MNSIKMMEGREFLNYIGGYFRGSCSSRTFKVKSPFFKNSYSILPESAEIDVIEAARFSRNAGKLAKEMPFCMRLEILKKTAASLSFSSKELLYAVEMTGMPLNAIEEKADIITKILSEIPILYQNSELENREPLGLIAAFTPGNDITASTFILANIVLTGGSGIIRPSSSEVYFTTKVAEALTENGYPPGAINVMNYSRENKLSPLLARTAVVKIIFGDDRTVSAMSKLGSGKTIGYGKGMAFAVVDGTADIEPTSGMLSHGGMRYVLGCNKTIGVRIARSIYDAIKEKLKLIVENLKVGDPREPGTDIGYIDSAPVFEGKGVLDHLFERVERLYSLGSVDFVLKGKKLSDVQAEPMLIVTGDPLCEFMINETPAYIITLCPVDNFREGVEQTEYVRSIKGLPSHLVISVFGQDQSNLDFAKKYYLEKGTAHNVHVNKPTTYIDPTSHQGISLPHELTKKRALRKFILS